MHSLTIAALLLAASLGTATGVAVYTFIYARGASYLTNDPTACANCHVMREHFEGWVKSTHHEVAVCNDCHTPASLIPKYFVKASNGFWHSFAFTTGRFPDPLRIKLPNREIVEHACRRCHADVVEAIEGPHRVLAVQPSCVRCHNSVGHLEGGPGSPLNVRLR